MIKSQWEERKLSTSTAFHSMYFFFFLLSSTHSFLTSDLPRGTVANIAGYRKEGGEKKGAFQSKFQAKLSTAERQGRLCPLVWRKSLLTQTAASQRSHQPPDLSFYWAKWKHGQRAARYTHSHTTVSTTGQGEEFSNTKFCKYSQQQQPATHALTQSHCNLFGD